MKVRKLKFNYLVCMFLGFSGILLSADLNISEVEKNISNLKELLNSIPPVGERQNLKIKRDPFAPMSTEKKVSAVEIKENTEENKKKEVPVVNVSGIVFNRKMRLAVIGNEVKKEGEYIGEYEVYRIEKDRVLLNYKGDILTFAVGKTGEHQ